MRIFDFLSRDIKKNEDIKIYTIFSDVTAKLYFSELAFYIAVSYIAETISKCEFKVYKDNKEVKDELYYLLNVSPNDNENANQFKEKIIERLLYDNESLVIENKEKFYVADSFGIDEKPLGQNKFTNIAVGIENIKSSKKMEDVFYFKLNNKKIKTLIDKMATGYDNLLKTAYESYESAISTKYKLKIDSVKAGDTDFNKEFEEVIKKQLKDFMDNPKAVYPEFEGYTLEQMKTPDGKTDSSDIQRIRKDMFETVAQAFKMPVSMLYGNMTNVKDIVNAYITFTIEPIVEMMNSELTRKTGTFEDWQRGNYIKIDITSIYHIDIFDVADKVDKLVSNGVYCVDEIRKKLGENLLKTDFAKQHWITKNYSTSEEALNPAEKGGD